MALSSLSVLSNHYCRNCDSLSHLPVVYSVLFIEVRCFMNLDLYSFLGCKSNSKCSSSLLTCTHVLHYTLVARVGLAGTFPSLFWTIHIIQSQMLKINIPFTWDVNWHFAPCHIYGFLLTNSVCHSAVCTFNVCVCTTYSLYFLFIVLTIIWQYSEFNCIYINQLEIICVGSVALANCKFILWSDILVVFIYIQSFIWAVNNQQRTGKCGGLTPCYKDQNKCILYFQSFLPVAPV